MNTEYEIEQQQREERLIKIQLDLSLSLNEQRELDKALDLCLEAAIKASRTDCGGIYLVDDTNDKLEMKSHQGLSPTFLREVLSYESGSKNFQLVREGRPVYAKYQQLGFPVKKSISDEHLRGIAVVPFSNKQKVIGCLNVASHTLEEIPTESRAALETIAVQIGTSINRLQTEQSLERTRREWENIFQAIGQPTLILDAGYNIISANRAAQKATGKKEHELAGKKCYQIFHQSGSPIKQCPVVAMLKSGRFETIEKSLEVLGGLYLVSCTPMLDEKGNLERIIHISTDITQRKRAEKAMQESEERFRTIFEGAAEGILAATIDTKKIVLANPKICEITGYTAAELMCLDVSQIHPSDALPQVIDVFNKQSRREIVTAFGIPVLRKDQSVVYCDISTKVMKIGSRDYQVGFFQDITERRRSEEELRFRSRMESLITRLSTRFINLKSAQIDTEINKALRELGKFVGVDRSYIFLFSPDNTLVSNTHEWCAEGIEPQIDRLQNLSTEHFSYVFDKIRRGEPVHIPRVADLPSAAQAVKEELEAEAIQSLISLPMPIGDRIIGFVGFDSVREEKSWSEDVISLSKIVGSIFANTLERKQTEEKIQVYQEQLHALASELLLTEDRQRQQIANDLHENIGQILALLKIKLGMLRETADPARTRKILAETDRALDQALNFTQSLTYELCPPILFEMGLEAALEWLLEHNQKEHGLEYRFENDHKQRRLHKDLSSFLFRAVRELLINVIKHARTDKVRVALYQNHHYLSILVEDYGVGFDAEGNALTAKGDGGFGLFSIRERLLHLGGRMKITSTVGTGTSVTLRVPLTKANLP